MHEDDTANDVKPTETDEATATNESQEEESSE